MCLNTKGNLIKNEGSDLSLFEELEETFLHPFNLNLQALSSRLQSFPKAAVLSQMALACLSCPRSFILRWGDCESEKLSTSSLSVGILAKQLVLSPVCPERIEGTCHVVVVQNLCGPYIYIYIDNALHKVSWKVSLAVVGFGVYFFLWTS